MKAIRNKGVNAQFKCVYWYIMLSVYIYVYIHLYYNVFFPNRFRWQVFATRKMCNHNFGDFEEYISQLIAQSRLMRGWKIIMGRWMDIKLKIRRSYYPKKKNISFEDVVTFEIYHYDFLTKNYFFAVNTISILSIPMRYWVVFCIEEYNLIFIDSFGMNPKYHIWDIGDFYDRYPGCKNIMLNGPIHIEFFYVCGVYTLVISCFI